ncbi:MAG TPA: hypothetical protein VHW90_03135 [Stellaceae bacterium]|jgi:hypothetical protein|nr:hypothetical protein [Stellaceae bacterium]
MDEGRTYPLQVALGWAWETQSNSARFDRGRAGHPTFVTLATSDRAAQSRIFARSVRECHPEARLAVLTIDSPASPHAFDAFDVVLSVEQLSISCLADFRFRYSIPELCFALKPWLLRHFLEESPTDPVYYFDSDIEIFTPLSEVDAALARGADLVLTPHILQPGPDPDSEKMLLRSGAYNGGFLAVAPSAQARALVAWWCERVRTACTQDALAGTYNDQKWLDLAPTICDGVAVLRHPGYNFAYWNAHERPLTCLGGTWSAAGWPLRFMHYSQWNMLEHDSEQYLAKYFSTEYQSFAGLFAEYQTKVRHEGMPDTGMSAPRFAPLNMPSGEPVPDVLREAYARHAPSVDGDAAEVFGRALGILNAASKACSDLTEPPITVLYDEIWQRHGNLRYRFDLDRAAGRLAYLRWLIGDGAGEIGLPTVFLNPARAALDRQRIRDLEADEPVTTIPASVPTRPAVVEPTIVETTDTVAALIAARDAERERSRQQANDIKLLVGNNKALRRELQGLRVRQWRDQEVTASLQEDLALAQDAAAALRRRNHALASEIASIRSQLAHPFSVWRRLSRSPAAPGERRQVIPGDAPFFERGFQLAETTAISGRAVRRIRNAPSGTLMFGPYIKLRAGNYAVSVEARLYRRLPLATDFRLDIACDEARQVLGLSRFRLNSLTSWRRFELAFTVPDDAEYGDYETRLWARKGTPLEIRSVDLYELIDNSAAA